MAKKIEKLPINKEFEKHMHDGHRVRLVDTMAAGGFHTLSKIQQLEFILFFIFPRGDVNPLAHRLLERYENLYAVLEAPPEDLARIPGMGLTSAKKLSSLLHIYDAYQLDKFMNGSLVDCGKGLYELLEQLLRFKNEETSYFFTVAPSGVVGNARRFGKGDASQVNINSADLINYVNTYKAHKLIFVHNHPNGDATPSCKDEEGFIKLNNVLLLNGSGLFDCYIVGRNGIYSWLKNDLVRTFAIKTKTIEGQENIQQKRIEVK